MNDLVPPSTISPLPPPLLFAIAAAMLVASLFAPVIDVLDETIRGWQAACMTALSCAEVAWWAILRREQRGLMFVAPMFLGTAANLTLLTTGVLGRKLRHRHAKPMLILAANGFLAGLAMPAIMSMNEFRFSLDAYDELYVGYWLWIASLALVAAGWGGVVWNQRLSRQAGLHPPETPAP